MATDIDTSNSGFTSDITKGLPSLQFENSLRDDEEPYLKLRTRAHAISLTICAHSTYFAAVSNRARQRILELQAPPQTKASKLLRDAPPRDPFHVGILGCGRLGTHLAHCLLRYADVQPSELLVSTRRPELLTSLTDRGVKCFHDNIWLVKSSSLIFLCILPSHLPDVAQEVKGHIPASSTVYSFLSSTPLSRLRQHLEFPCVVRSEVIARSDEVVDEGWSWKGCSRDMCTALSDQGQVAVTCPLNPAEKCMVTSSSKLAELILYSLVNLCTSKGLSRDDTVSLVNHIILGKQSKDSEAIFQSSDFMKRRGDFPVFDIAAVASRETPLTKPILENQSLRELFHKQYINTFNKPKENKKDGRTLIRDIQVL